MTTKATSTGAHQQSDGTRERILDATAVVLTRKGFAGTRLVDVGEQADLQAPAIYHYFKSREELIEEVVVTGVQQMHDCVLRALEAAPAEARPIDQLLIAVEAHLRQVLVASAYTTAATRNGGQLPDHLRHRYESARQAYGDVWRGLLTAAAEAGELKPDVDLGIVRMLVLGALDWTAEWWRPERGSFDQLVKTTQAVVLNGIAFP
ncbi:TetR family transcriptional regulator [Gordonia paraffinivorans]|uniref:TetR/AcrR family transcriptional regulator n=1 Tax=Gordonia paraffinivorans TaxID=175628 RepID=UPI001C92F29A|nr:TetR family transcriptional regulator [Gordonia paraffinivorans]MBY4575619.1 TetR family transcriptional regulator [Gordonia paraffinivorans]